MSGKLWTASVQALGGKLMAQCKGSRDELMRRLRADDPVWRVRPVSMTYSRRLPKSLFRRGLAIQFTQ